MPNSGPAPKRRVFGRLSIASGNFLQVTGIAASCALLAQAGSTSSRHGATAAMIGAWLLLYFFCHGIAHWAVGRVLGIGFAFYTIGGTGNPEGYPGPLRWVFEHLPFFGVQSEKASMQAAGPLAKAIMWSAGITSSALIPTLGAFWAWRSHVPRSGPFLIFAVIWALGALASNWTSRAGDFAKARRALART